MQAIQHENLTSFQDQQNEELASSPYPQLKHDATLQNQQDLTHDARNSNLDIENVIEKVKSQDLRGTQMTETHETFERPLK